MDIVHQYLDLLDSQREAAFAALEELTDSRLWHRPAPREWIIGEILDHNFLLFASTYPIVRWMWKLFGWYGRLHRQQPYATEIEDLYRSPKFPMWVGFLWTPRFNSRKPVSLEDLKTELRVMHGKVRRFYEDKDHDILGNWSDDPEAEAHDLIHVLTNRLHNIKIERTEEDIHTGFF